jgi:hypothetical protein
MLASDSDVCRYAIIRKLQILFSIYDGNKVTIADISLNIYGLLPYGCLQRGFGQTRVYREYIPYIRKVRIYPTVPPVPLFIN